MLVDDGHGDDDLLYLMVEVKRRRREDAKEKPNTMRQYWIPDVNNHGGCGRWAVAESTDVYAIEADVAVTIESSVAAMLEPVLEPAVAVV